MTSKSTPDQDQDRRKANRRLAVVLGVIALVFYLFIVVLKPVAGA